MYKNIIYILIQITLYSATSGSEQTMDLRSSSVTSEDRSSLVFVFDTTGSMHDDLKQLRDGAEKIMNTALQDGNVIGNFVFVPFHDPIVGPATVTKDKEVFKKALDMVRVYGGGDCPEKSLSGIQLALKVSAPKSYIYVFTDATSGDHQLVGQVLDAVQRKQSQIVFILTGLCNDDDFQRPSFQVYQQIAAASSGQIFNLNKTSVHKVLEFVKSSVKGRNVNLGSSVNPAGSNYTQEVPVDSTLGDVTVSVSGARPQISVVNPSGEQLTGPPKLVTTLDLSEIMILKVLQPEPGNWTVTVGSDEDYSVKVVGQSNLTFNYGFSIEKPDNMAETSYRPLKGAYNHMMLSLTEDYPVNIDLAEIISLEGKTLFEIPVKKSNDSKVYLTDAFLPPDDFFYVSIKGTDEYKQELRRMSTTAVQAKTPDIPYLTVPVKMHAHPHTRVVLKCKVESLVPVIGAWYRGHKLLTKVDSLQTTTVEYVIDDMRDVNVGRYRCVGKNDAGVSEAATRLVMLVEPPQVSIITSNTTLEEGDDLNVTCTVYSEAPLSILQLRVITADYNNSLDMLPDSNTYSYIKGESFSKVFKAVNESNSGDYTCIAGNKGGSTNESIQITVESHPSVEIIGPRIIKQKRNTTAKLTCRVKNCNIIKWISFNGSIVKETSLMDNGNRVNDHYDVLEVNVTDDSVMKCVGVKNNIEVSDTIQIISLIKPKVYINDKHITLLSGTVGQVECEVIANPTPSIKWYQNGIESSNYSLIEKSQNLYKSILFVNSTIKNEGVYTCVTNNSEGSSNDTVIVKYRKPMEIVSGFNDTSVKLYESVKFNCNVISYPEPTTTWYHNNSVITTSNNIQTDKNNTILYIKRIDFNNLGTYSCNASNEYESVVLNATLSVTGLEAPVILKENSKQIVDEGESTVLSCRIIQSYPKPTIIWQYKNSTLKHFITLRNVSKDIQITNVSVINNGIYRCIVENVVGIDSHDLELIVRHAPKFKANNSKSSPLEVENGGNVTLKCEADGNPRPIVVWYKDGRPLTFSTNVVLVNQSDLLMSNVTIDHSGQYTCKVVNNLGFIEKNFTVFVYVPPKIKTPENDIPTETLEGDLVELPCEVEGVPPPAVRWEHNGITINDEHKIIDRFGIRFIANLTDFGDYKCIANNKYGTATISHTVYIWVPPRIKPPIDSSVNVLIGGNVSVCCDVIGFPIPTVQWEHNNQIIAENSTEISFNEAGSLNITNASSTSEGLYTCVAENIAGVQKKYVYINVYAPPKILEDNYTGKYIATNMDTELVISCKVRGKPKPVVVWVLDDAFLDSDPRYKLEMDGTLKLLSPTEDMSGNYTCIAKNMFGTENKTVPVEIYSILSQTQSEETHTTVKLLEHTAVNIPCPIKASTVDTVKWYKDAVHIATGNLQITNVTRSLQATYACVVQNAVGSAYSNVYLDVEYPPTFIDNINENQLNYQPGTSSQGLELFDDGLELVENNDSVKLLEVVEGDDVYLDCRVDAKPAAKTKWLLNSKPLLFKDKPRLKLINVQQSSSGLYKCIVNNIHGTVIKEFNVNVLVAPFISEFDMLDVVLMVGVNATLECNAKGYPQPNVYWTYNNTDWHLDDTTLVANITPDSEGIYRCDARNKAGATYIVYRVSVVSRPKIEEIMTFRNGKGEIVDGFVEAEQSKHIRIACKASGKPTPIIKWLRNGKVVGTNIEGVEYADLSLDVATSNGGKFTCVASNEGGDDERPIKLEVLEPPRIFKSMFHDSIGNVINMEVLLGQAYYLHCHTYGTPVPEVYWFKDDLPLKLFDDTMITTDFGEVIEVKSANAEQSGNYTCVARNKVGNTSLVYLVDVLEPPPKPKESMKSVNIRVGRTLTLPCPVQGSPRPYVMWIKHPYTEVNGDSPRMFFEDDNVTLIINPTQVSDSGNYSCIMTNKVGTTEFIFDVTVEKPPSIAGNIGSNNVEYHQVALRRSIVLKCEADGHPLPKIRWLKDTQTISDSWSNVHLVLGNSLLAIWRVSSAAAGQYVCVAESRAGAAHRTYNVAVTVPGKWNDWSKWSLCNVTCGLGYQFKYRTCQYIDENNRVYDKTSKSDSIVLDETSCKGPSSERRKCHMPPCEVIKSVMWSPWSRWAPCSSSCGEGTQARTRKCRTKHCTGDNVQIRKCPDLPPCEPKDNILNNEVLDIETNDTNSYPPEAVFESTPQILESKYSPDVEEFYGPPVEERVYFDVNVTFNMDGSERGPCEVGFTYDDENNTCDDVDECLVDNNECHSTQVCVNTAGGYICTCPPGFVSLGPGQRCMDINECTQDISGCEFACVNVAGGYVCACPNHMRLSADRHHCYTVSPLKKSNSFEDIDPEYMSASIEYPARYKHIR